MPQVPHLFWCHRLPDTKWQCSWWCFCNFERLIFNILDHKLTEKLMHFFHFYLVHFYSYLEHKTNNWVRSKINFLVCPQKPLLVTVKRWILAWFGHVTHCYSLSETILQGTLEGGRHHSWQRKCWMDNIKEWIFLPMPELLTRASSRKDGKRFAAESSVMTPSMTQLVEGLKWTIDRAMILECSLLRCAHTTLWGWER